MGAAVGAAVVELAAVVDSVAVDDKTDEETEEETAEDTLPVTVLVVAEPVRVIVVTKVPVSAEEAEVEGVVGWAETETEAKRSEPSTRSRAATVMARRDMVDTQYGLI